jgi:hypothetical protein
VGTDLPRRRVVLAHPGDAAPVRRRPQPIQAALGEQESVEPLTPRALRRWCAIARVPQTSGSACHPRSASPSARSTYCAARSVLPARARNFAARPMRSRS